MFGKKDFRSDELYLYLDLCGGYQHCHFLLQFSSMTKYENISFVEILAVGSNKKPIISLSLCVCVRGNFDFF